VIGLRGWIADPPAAAERLSATGCADTALSSEVLGACLRMRHAVSCKGARTELVESPEGAWSAGATCVDAPMPLYRDVEQLAFALLLDRGIPPTAALLGTCPVDRDPAAMEALGAGVRLSLARGAVVRAPVTVRGFRFGGADVPVLPRQIGRDFGVALFDDRFVDGEPSAAAVNRLVQLEQKILERARRSYGAEATLTMLYHSGAFQDELDELLRARGCSVPVRAARSPSLPWWQFWRYLGRWR
jgi:hypothetical protein